MMPENLQTSTDLDCRHMLVMSVVGLNIPTFLFTHVIWAKLVLDPLKAGQHVC